jgi:hypothetical protein
MVRTGRRWELTVRTMQVGIVGIFLVGVGVGNLAVVVNAAFAIGVTLLPAVLERDWDVRLSPGVTLWITAAVFLHAVGMLGLYETVPWWDHLTHFVSAALVAGVGYAAVRAFDEHSDALTLPPRFTAVFVLVFTLALGVTWEVVEFGARLAATALGMETVLVQYGLQDTLVDLLFDAAGALVVAAFGPRRLGSTVDAVRRRLDAAAVERRTDGERDRDRL